MKNVYYIGVACTWHDPAICIVDGKGNILFAEATERYTQDKRAIGTIADNVIRAAALLKEYCHPDAEFVIARTWSRSKLVKLNLNSLLGILKLREWVLRPFTKKIPKHMFSAYKLSWIQALSLSSINQGGLGFKKAITYTFPNSKIKDVYHEHHECHAAYACFSSPFDEGVCVIVDGHGEKGTTSVYAYKDKRIKLVRESRTLGSLGLFYQILTQVCGYSYLKGEEWKVMGLAPYGKKHPKAYQLFSELLYLKGLDFKMTSFRKWQRNLEKLGELSLKARNSKALMADISFSGQLVYSELMIAYLNKVYAVGISKKLIFGGGCALNSAFNGTILSRTSFEELSVPSAPGDDGTAIGASLLSLQQDAPDRVSEVKKYSPYLGSGLNKDTLHRLVNESGLQLQHLPHDIHRAAAELLAEDKIIGWMQGRAEFSPRALGNRSILANAASPNIKDRINSLVKFREDFRPFAPSILHEFGDAYFENYQTSFFMERVLVFKEEVRHKVPGVVHIDNTGRLQSVTKEINPSFYSLIEEFNKITGIPLLLNTSFNVMGKPILHSIEEAIGVFFTTGMNALVIDDYLLTKQAL